MSSDLIYLDEATKARKAGNLQGAFAELLDLFDSRSDSSSEREEAWLEHFVGRFADRENERPHRGGVCFAANVLWDACRQAAVEDGHRNWFETCDMAKVEQVMLRVAPADEKTQSLVTGAVEVVRAACALARERDDSYTSFPMHFSNTARHYAAFLNARSPDAERIADLQPAAIEPSPRTADLYSEAWLAWVRESTTATVTDLQQEWLYSVPGMCVPVGLAMAEHALLWVCGIDLPIERDRMTTIVFAGEKPDGGDFGVFAHLRIQRHGEGSNVFYPDPVALGLMSLDAEWTTSFDDAARFIERHSKEPLGRCSWSLRFPWWGDVVGTSGEAKKRQQRVIRLEGSSASAAAACALHAVATNSPLDTGISVTAQVAEDGKLLPVAGRLAKVLGVSRRPPGSGADQDRKVEPQTGSDDFLAAVGNYVHRLLTPDPSEWLKQAGPRHGLRVQPVEQAAAAIDWTCGRLDAFLRYLRRLAVHGLGDHVHFLPDIPREKLSEFCLPVSVVPVDQRRRAVPRYDASDVVYRGSLEDELHQQTRYLRHVLAAEDPVPRFRVVLEAKAGEGKTVALFLSLAEHCRRLEAELAAGRLGFDDPMCRVPLALLLSSIPSCADGDEPLDLVRRAREFSFTVAGDLLAADRLLQEAFDEKLGGLDDLGRERHEMSLWLDALDEMPGDRDDTLKNQLARLADHVPILLTTRPSRDYFSLVPRAVSWCLAGFNQRQQRRFIDGYFDAAGGQELAQRIDKLVRLSPGPSELARVPLLLSILCWLAARHPSEPLPRNRTVLLRYALHSLLNRGDEKRGRIRDPLALFFDRNLAKERILRHVAWQFFDRGPRILDRQGLKDVIRKQLPLAKDGQYERVDDAETLLEEFKQDGILVPAGREALRFVFRSFHEFLLAGWIACESPPIVQGDHEQFKRMIRGRADTWERHDWQQIRIPESDACFKPLNQPGWENVWPLVAGQLASRADLLAQAVLAEDEDVALSRVRLAGAICGEGQVAGEFRETVRQKLISAVNWGWLALQSALALCQLGDAQGREFRIPMYREDSPRWMPFYWGVSSDASGDDTQDRIIATLESEDSPEILRAGSAWQLARLGPDDRAREALTTTLDRQDVPELVRCQCAEALGQIDDNQVREALTGMLDRQDVPELVRRRCAFALAQLTDPRARKYLIAALDREEVSEDVRWECAFALTQLRDPRARQFFIATLDREDPSRLDTLGQVGDAWLREFLIAMLQREDVLEWMREECAEALGKIGDDRARDALIATLDREDMREGVTGVCTRAAQALVQIGDDRARDAFVAGLDREDISELLRGECAQALGKIGDDRARDALIATLVWKDVPEQVQLHSAIALGHICDRRARDALIASLHRADLSDWVRGNCAGALGHIGDRHARGALSATLEAKSCGEDLAARVLESADDVRRQTGWRLINTSESNFTWQSP